MLTYVIKRYKIPFIGKQESAETNRHNTCSLEYVYARYILKPKKIKYKKWKYKSRNIEALKSK